MLVVSGSGIRGIFGESLTVDAAARFAAAFGTLCGPGEVVVGRDTRATGPAMEAAVCAGLMATGCSPVMLGIVPTPTVQLEAMADGARGGIAVTASHNPSEWNALKLIASDGVFLRSDDRQRLLHIIADGGETAWKRYTEAGTPADGAGAIDRHVDRILAMPMVLSSGRPLRVVLDPGGGASRALLPPLIDRLGATCTVINAGMTPEGAFPRKPEPVREALGGLCGAVRDMEADVGMALDPDGDRLALVDENGRAVGEEMTVALAMDYVLASRPGPCVVNLSTSMHSDFSAARNGADIHRSPVGEVNVVELMERTGASIGGEGNGGVIDFQCHPGRDGGVAAAYVISLLRDRDLPLSALVDSFPPRTIVKEKLAVDESFELLAPRLIETFGEPSDTRDGLWFGRNDGFTHIRPSGTEPVVRFVCEDTDEDVTVSQTRMFREAACG